MTFREIINGNQGLFNPSTERPLTNKEAREKKLTSRELQAILKDNGIDYITRFGFSDESEYQRTRIYAADENEGTTLLTGLTRSELLAWIKGAS